MKIGIITLPLHTNYGGILQAYALKTFLESLGHEAVMLLDAERYREFADASDEQPAKGKILTYILSKFTCKSYTLLKIFVSI